MSRPRAGRRACVAVAVLFLACALPTARAADGAGSDSQQPSASNPRAVLEDSSDPCTDVDVFAVFPKHVGGSSTHARFDVRALNVTALGVGGGNLGFIEGSSSSTHDTKVTGTFCLPRGSGFFLIASGNATRGSAFARFTVSVTSREWHNMTLFSAGSEWTRGAAYDADDAKLATAHGGSLSRFTRDVGVGPPLWDTFDPGHTYELHGRARFDTWVRNPSAVGVPKDPNDSSMAVQSAKTEKSAACGALVAVFVTASPYGNGAAPGDMSWSLLRAGDSDLKNALTQVSGDAFQWGASVAHVVCLPPGDYDLVAFDAGLSGRGWGHGVSLEVLELVSTEGNYFHGYTLNSGRTRDGWFTTGRSAVVKIAPKGRARTAEAAATNAVATARLGGVRLVQPLDAKKQSPRRALLELGGPDALEKASVSLTHVAASTAAVALVVAAIASASVSSRPVSQQEDLASLLKNKPGGGSAADRALLRSKNGKYGASAFDAAPVVTARDGAVVSHAARRRISTSALVVAATAGVVAAAGVIGGDNVFTFHGVASLGGAPTPAPLGLADASMCGMGIPGCSVLEPPQCSGRAYTYKPGMLAHLQGGVGIATALAASAEWTEAELLNTYTLSLDHSSEHSLIDVNHGLCDIVERIEGSTGIDWSDANVDWADPKSSLGGKKRAAKDAKDAAKPKPTAELGDAQSGCVTDVGGFENATLDFCREMCRREDKCVSYHAFRVVAGRELTLGFDVSRNEDTHADYACRMCGAGGEGVFTPESDFVQPDVTVDSSRGPAWCLTEHRLTFLVDDVEQCATACDKTRACDAFNFGVNHGDCLLLHLGENATAGAVWRGSAGSTAGVAGYATYYAKSPSSIQQAVIRSDLVSAKNPDAQTVMAPSRADRVCGVASSVNVTSGNATDAVAPVANFVAGALDETGGQVTDTSSLTISSTATVTTGYVTVTVLDTAGSAARRPASPPPPAAATPLPAAAASAAPATSAPASTSSIYTKSTVASPGSPTPGERFAFVDDTGFDANPTPAATPAATPVIEHSGVSENVDAAEKIEKGLDEPVSEKENEPMSGVDGVVTPEETAEGVVTHAARDGGVAVERAGELVVHAAENAGDSVEHAGESVLNSMQHGADDAGDSAEDAGDAILSTLDAAGHSVQHGAEETGDAIVTTLDAAGHSIQHGAHDAGVSIQQTLDAAGDSAQRGADATGDALEDAGDSIQVATTNTVDGVMSAIDGAFDQLTHHSDESDDESPDDAQSTKSTSQSVPESTTDSDGEAFDANSFEEPGDGDANSSSDSTSSSETTPFPVPGSPEAAAAAETARRANAAYDDSGVVVVIDNGTPPPPPAPIFIPSVLPTLMEQCSTCTTPPCHVFEEDVKETDFIIHAESCCQATGWRYGNTANFPHMCGECAENKQAMPYAKALHHCDEVGGGLCANNQVTAGTRTPGCSVAADDEVWTSEGCGERDEGRYVMAAGGGKRRCEFDLTMTKQVVCCANTCNTFIPDHMCPSSGREFWQATAGAGAGASAGASAAASAAMGAPRRRDPTVRVALPDLPAVKAARAMAGAKLGRPFKMAALGDALEKSEVLAAARAALGGDGA